MTNVDAIKLKLNDALKLFPFETKSIDEFRSKLNTYKINFVDITFPP